MPGQFLSEKERGRLGRFPEEVTARDLAAFFTLTEADLTQVAKLRGEANKLGFAVQLAALRLMGFAPTDLSSVPHRAVRYLADQLEVPPAAFADYGERERTRHVHLQRAMRHLGFRRHTARDLEALETWLTGRAMEHDRPSLLLEQAATRLKREKLLRPGVTVLERIVTSARQAARHRSLQVLRPILTAEVKARLDALLVTEDASDDDTLDSAGSALEGHTTLHWLRQGATTSSPQAIQNATAKLTFLRKIGAADWDLSALNPNRVRRLAALGRRYTGQALRRMGPERRYPILVCFLRRAFVTTIDEAADLFDECMKAVHRRSRRALREEHEATRRATEEKVRLFYHVGRLVLDGSIPDGDLRTAVFRRISPLELSAAVDEAEAIMRPAGIGYFDFLERRFSYLRQFVPAFLEAMPLRATRRGDPVMEGVEVLRRMNREGRRKVPEEAPTRFVPRKWQPFVFDEGGEDGGAGGDGAPASELNRRGWELCLLTELQGRLRSGDVYLAPSRRYADPETYLISKETWPALREEVADELGAPTDGRVRIRERRAELEELLHDVNRLVRRSASEASIREASIRFENGQLVVSPLPAAEKDPRVDALKEAVTGRLPRVGLAGLLVEVDALTGFSRHLTRPGSRAMRKKKLLPSLYAAIVAHGTGMGPTQMAQSSGISYDRLAWASTWHLREETLKAAVTELVNFHDRQPLAALWGGGTLSSSDGQRFPVRGKVRQGRPLPKYFGYGRGVTFYTWTSDQYSQFGTQVIPSTVRDATYVLDEILDNESDLNPKEHAVDTSGTTEIIFALFDLLGLRFSPRIRDLGEQRLYQAGGMEVPGPLGSRFRSKVSLTLIEEGWDDLLRIAGSLKRGHCPASLLVSKLQSYPRQNRLTRLL